MPRTVIYKRNLPHIHPQNAILFITFRLADTIPKKILRRLLYKRNQELKYLRALSISKTNDKKYLIERRFFARYDNWLDRCDSDRRWLEKPQLANIVKNKIHVLDGVYYVLISFCIMPNHVHLLIQNQSHDHSFPSLKTRNYPVANMLRVLKGTTARECNKMLERKGAFWHHESYDHVVRDEKELTRIVNYILLNPVKAGIAESKEDWKYSYFNRSFKF